MPLRRPAKATPAPFARTVSTDTAAAPAAFRLVGDVVGDAASPQALARLNAALAELKALAVAPLLQKAIEAIRRENPKAAADHAMKALGVDETCGYAWYLLAIAREGAGDFKTSLECYEAALKLMPSQTDVANDLGRLASRLGMKGVAEQLFRTYVAANPKNVDGLNNLACVIRDQNRYEEAIAVLSPAINDNPQCAILWNTLATVLAEQGEPAQSLTFFDEACRLDPKLLKARYNRGNAKLSTGDCDGALADCEAALGGVMAEHERAMMQLAHSTMRIAKGDLGLGWDGYEARLSPHYADVTHFLIDRPRWDPGSDLTGKSVLIMGEQGLGDEVLFANVLPDMVEAVGPGGKVALAVQPRLMPLFQRSFPTVEVGYHHTFQKDGRTFRGAPCVKDIEAVDLWAPIASPLRRFRRRVEDFPDRPRFLVAAPERVAFWREQLAAAGPGPKVGLVWKSLRLDGARLRHFSPFEKWRPILETPGITFVNLQYGDSDAEIDEARARLGVDIWRPPGIDLKDDLDDVAALACALDLTIGPANATTNIAAACGAPVWLISTPGAWPRLGTDRYPWYPQARVFTPPAFNDWAPAMAQAAEALARLRDEGTEGKAPG